MRVWVATLLATIFFVGGLGAQGLNFLAIIGLGAAFGFAFTLLAIIADEVE